MAFCRRRRHHRRGGALTLIRGGARKGRAIGTIIKLAKNLRAMRGRGRF